MPDPREIEARGQDRPESRTGVDALIQRAKQFDGAVQAAARRGGDMIREMERLWPICRALSGPGIRETFDILAETIPLRRHRIASGTKVLDWVVPKEWTIRDAYIKDSRGRKVVDFQESNLHVVHYSTPVRARMNLSELKPRLHSIPELPDAIPYITSHYDETWGFA